MVVNVAKIFKQMKKKPLLVSKKILQNEKKTLYYKYKKVFYKEKYQKFQIFDLEKFPPEI